MSNTGHTERLRMPVRSEYDHPADQRDQYRDDVIAVLKQALRQLADAAEDTLHSHELVCCAVTRDRCAQARELLTDEQVTP